MIESRCGILCSKCKYREQTGCSGCTEIEKPFWANENNCPVKSCCEDKKQSHCGDCDNFACEQLTAFAYDEKEGDDGKRLEQCKIWKSVCNKFK